MIVPLLNALRLVQVILLLFLSGYAHAFHASKVKPIPWLIVGGGPHGVHIAARLLEEAVPALSRSDVCIVDDGPRLLHGWKERTAATGMTHLRSSSSFHLDVREDSLRKYAAKALSANAGGEGASKKKKKRGNKKREEGDLFTLDYQRPQLDFFNDHCDHVIAKNSLADSHVQGMVTDIVPHEDHVLVKIQRPDGDVAETNAQNVVLALGSAAPAYPDWVDQEMIRSGKVRHILDINSDSYGNNNNHDDSDTVSRSHRHRSIAVVGGGISAAHLALKLDREARKTTINAKDANAHNANIHLICRHELREQQFDTHQDWMMTYYATKRSEAGGGKGVPDCQRQFANLASFEERRSIIQRERRAGTISAAVGRGRDGLRYAIQSERIRWHQASINGVSESEEDGQLFLSLSSGEEVVVDEIILATGFERSPPGSRLINSIACRNEGLKMSPCGYPAPDKQLRWHNRIYLAGALAELELGPSARNIAGAWLASERIVAAASVS